MDLFNIDPVAPEPNPMVKDFGKLDPPNKCKNCANLRVRYMAKKYFKCTYRGDTRGAATDHRVNWSACNNFINNQ